MFSLILEPEVPELRSECRLCVLLSSTLTRVKLLELVELFELYFVHLLKQMNETIILTAYLEL